MDDKRAMLVFKTFVDPKLRQLCPDFDSEDIDMTAIEAIAAELNPSLTNQMQNNLCFDKTLNFSSNSGKGFAQNDTNIGMTSLLIVFFDVILIDF